MPTQNNFVEALLPTINQIRRSRGQLRARAIAPTQLIVSDYVYQLIAAELEAMHGPKPEIKLIVESSVKSAGTPYQTVYGNFSPFGNNPCREIPMTLEPHGGG